MLDKNKDICHDSNHKSKMKMSLSLYNGLYGMTPRMELISQNMPNRIPKISEDENEKKIEINK